MSDELDYHVCQHVLGWTKHLRDTVFPIHKPKGWAPPKEDMYEDYYWNWVPPEFAGNINYARARPRPSTVMADAFLVVKKLQDMKAKVKMQSTYDTSLWFVEVLWSVQAAKHLTCTPPIGNASLQVAICEAALIAVNAPPLSKKESCNGSQIKESKTSRR